MAVKLIVMYPRPKDIQAFETVYKNEHLPLAVEKLKGKTKIVATRVLGSPNGKPAFHRIAEIHFDSMPALEACAISEGGKRRSRMQSRFLPVGRRSFWLRRKRPLNSERYHGLSLQQLFYAVIPSSSFVHFNKRKGQNIMKKMLYKLVALCVLAMPFAAVAQSTDNMKHDQSQQDNMKHDDMSQDQSKKDDMGKDSMKGKKAKKAKKDKMKKDDMKKDDNMKKDDMKDDGMKQN